MMIVSVIVKLLCLLDDVFVLKAQTVMTVTVQWMRHGDGSLVPESTAPSNFRTRIE
jgi:hypothetical protein